MRRLRTRRRDLLAAASLVVSALVASLTPAPSVAGSAMAASDAVAAGNRPNVVVFMADDMRHDDLSFMPRLRRLVRDNGVSFENSFSPYPLCCPARASFLTGRAAHNHKVYWHAAPYGFGAFDDSFTLATAMRRAGYNTGFVGKYINRYGAQRSRVTGRASHTYVPRGWDEWRAALDRPRRATWSGGTYSYFNTAYNVNGRVADRFRGDYQTNTIGSMTRRMVTKFHDRRAPFFVFSSFVAPHAGGPEEGDDPGRVRRSDGGYTDMVTPARPRWVRGRFDRLIVRPAGMPQDGGPSEVDVRDKPGRRFHDPEMNWRERRAVTEVTRQRAEALFVLDQEVARTVSRLKKTGEWADTVFVFTSDNGYYLGEHRRRIGKVNAHEPVLRVPLLVTGPGLRTGQSRFDPVTTMDLTATVADLGGARFPWPLEGTSMLSTLRGGDQGWNRPVLTEALYGSTDGRLRTWRVSGYPEFQDARGAIGIRVATYKLVAYSGGFIELYDLARDPHELEGVTHDPAYADVKAALLDLWWRTKDCRGSECVAPLPEHLRTPADQNRAATQHMMTERVVRYGR